MQKPNYYFLKPNLKLPKPNYELQKPYDETHNLKPNYGIVQPNWQFLNRNSDQYSTRSPTQSLINSTNKNYNKNIEKFSNPENFLTSTEAESVVIQPSTQFSGIVRNKYNISKNTHHAFQPTTVSNIESTISVPPVLQPTVSSSFNNSNITSYRHPDLLKQMKLQFVLDCALVDRNTQTRIPLDSSIPENIQNLLPNSKAQTSTTSTTTTTTVKPLRPLAPTSVQTTVYRIPPRRDPVKYIDPPVLDEISDVFEDVYSYFEEALTTKVVSKPQKIKKIAEVYNFVHVTPAQQLQLNTQSDPNHNHKQQHRTTRKVMHSRIKTNPLPQRRPLVRFKRTTIHPTNKYGTSAQSQNKKNYMTTNIHVTSEYNGPNPTSSLEANAYAKKRRPTINSASNDDDDDDYVDYGEDENLGLDQLNIMSEDDDDSSSNSESDESKPSGGKDDDEDYSLRTPNKLKKSRRKNSKKVKLPTKSEEEEEEDYYGQSMGLFGGFFETVFSSFGRFLPSFLMPDDSYDDQESRSTTPRTEWRKPKNPTAFQASTEDLALTGREPWFNPWFFGTSNEIDEVTTATMPTTTESDSWNWFGSEDKKPESAVTTEKNGNLFIRLLLFPVKLIHVQSHQYFSY